MSKQSTFEPTSLGTTMRSSVQHAFGDVATILIKEVAVPLPASGEVLIRTRAAGINPVDAWISGGGNIGSPIPDSELQTGVTLGWDMAGDIVSVGENVTQYSVGDRVFGMIRFPDFGKTFAEFVAAPVDEIRAIPEGIGYDVAGALPLVGLAAWQALFDDAGLQSGQRILVHGASGGVGHIAVQLAKQAGAYVIATASAANAEFVRSLGADEVTAYDEVQFEDVVHDVDVVFNPFFEDVIARSWSTLKPGGFLVSLMATPTDAPNGIRSTRTSVVPSGEKIGKLADLLASGDLRVHIGQRFSFDRIQDAFQARTAGHSVGKIVIEF